MDWLIVPLAATGLVGAAVAIRALITGGWSRARIPNRRVAAVLLIAALAMPAVGLVLTLDSPSSDVQAGATSTTVYRAAIADSNPTTSTAPATTTSAPFPAPSTTTTTGGATTTSAPAKSTTSSAPAASTTTTVTTSPPGPPNLRTGYYSFSCTPSPVSFPVGGSAPITCRVAWSEDGPAAVVVTCPEGTITCAPKQTTLNVVPGGANEIVLTVTSTTKYPISGGQLRVSADARGLGLHSRVAKVDVQVTSTQTTTSLPPPTTATTTP